MGLTNTAFTNKNQRLVLFELTTQNEIYLDGFDQVSCSICNLLGRLNKVPFSNGVSCFGGGETAGIAQRRGVLSNNGGC